jgi:succinate dehydrogenase / fumarate reductase flavoprotein subunit
MGGLWVDYNLQSNIPGLFVAGEANFSDHGANRLGASALMQGLADGYFVLPVTIGDYLATLGFNKVDAGNAAFKQAEADVKENIKEMLAINGKVSPDHLHRELGKIMWNNVGMARNEQGLKQAISDIKGLKEEYAKNLRVVGTNEELNNEIEKAGRLADFLELGQLMAEDALARNESCGGHFRTEYQTPEGEAMRNDEQYSYVAAWEYKGKGQSEELHKEELKYEYVKPSQRSYK